MPMVDQITKKLFLGRFEIHTGNQKEKWREVPEG